MARHARPDDDRNDRRGRFAGLTVGWIGLWGLILVLALADLVGLWLGEVTAADADGALQAALISGVMVALGVFRLRWLVIRERRDARPAVASGDPPSIRAEKHHRLPGPKSSARQPMRQLAEAEAALAELMRQLIDGSAVPSGAVEEAWRVAAHTATELRTAAAKLEAVELAVEHVPSHERAELANGILRLRKHIDRGLDGYRSLIAAAGRVLIASASAPAGEELGEATEHLAGLAQALHELSGDYDR